MAAVVLFLTSCCLLEGTLVLAVEDESENENSFGPMRKASFADSWYPGDSTSPFLDACLMGCRSRTGRTRGQIRGRREHPPRAWQVQDSHRPTCGLPVFGPYCSLQLQGALRDLS